MTPHAKTGRITLGPGQNLVVEVKVGSVRFFMTVDTGAARTLVKDTLAKRLRESPLTSEYTFELLLSGSFGVSVFGLLVT